MSEGEGPNAVASDGAADAGDFGPTFARMQGLAERVKHACDDIRAGRPVVFDASAASAADADDIVKSFSDLCRECWGHPPRCEVAGRVWTITPPSWLLSPPLFCWSCGAALTHYGTDLRWQPPGKAGRVENGGASGWEHRCECDCPQAGHFTADRANPHAAGSPAYEAWEADRFKQWEKNAAARTARWRGVFAKTHFHNFVEDVACAGCGLSVAAYEATPAAARFDCPAAPPKSS